MKKIETQNITIISWVQKRRYCTSVNSNLLCLIGFKKYYCEDSLLRIIPKKNFGRIFFTTLIKISANISVF